MAGSKTRRVAAKPESGRLLPLGMAVAVLVALLATVLRYLPGRPVSDATNSQDAAVDRTKSDPMTEQHDAKSDEITVQRIAAEAKFNVTMKLKRLADLAATLEAAGKLEEDGVIDDLESQLVQVEGDIRALVSNPRSARDLLAVATIVRGTLRKKVGGLTDAEVSLDGGDAFTFASATYWDNYYKETSADEHFDWLVSWDTEVVEVAQDSPRLGSVIAMSSLLRPYVGKSPKLLNWGCGNSNMAEMMYRDGLEDITNVDISEHALANVRSRLGASMPRMTWLHMNVTELQFETGTFDAILDKSTMDALEFDPAMLEASVREAHRVLRPGGFFISFSFRQPWRRLDRQLNVWAQWSECHTHEVVKTASKVTKDVVYIYACARA